MSSACVQAASDLLAALQASPLDEAGVDRCVRALGAAQRGVSADESAAALELLAGGLDLPEAVAAQTAARVLGAMIEQGHDPQPAITPMLATLRRLLPGCVELADAARAVVATPPDGVADSAAAKRLARRYDAALQGAAEGLPDAADAWARLSAIWPGAIALLSADPAARREAADLRPQLDELGDLHEAGGWLRAILAVLHQEPYVAIEPATRTAISGRVSGVVENFQLTTLLMDALPWTGQRRVSRSAVMVARGVGQQQTKETVTGTWNLYAYAALGSDRTLPDEVGEHSIVPEGSPAGIPVLDGHRVILVGPASEERSWPVQRMFASLPAMLTRDVLVDAAVDDWLDRIAAAR